MEKHGFHLIICSLGLALYITSKCNLWLVDMILLYKAAKMQLFNAFIRKCWCECKMLNVQHRGVSGSGIAYLGNVRTVCYRVENTFVEQYF